jgi:hypothetical protein
MFGGVAADGAVRHVEDGAVGHDDGSAVALVGIAIRDGAILQDERRAPQLDSARAAKTRSIRDVNVAEDNDDAGSVKRVDVEDAVQVCGVDGWRRYRWRC